MSNEFVIDTAPIDTLTVNEIQARKKLGGIKELADSIKQHGLFNPIQVWATTDDDGNEKLIVLGGHRRLKAVELLLENGEANGLTDGVPIRRVEAASLAEARIKALVDNTEREELTSFEIATECAILKEGNGEEEPGMSQKDIAKALSKSEAWVSAKLKTLASAGPELTKAWKAGKLPDETVEVLAKLEGDEQEAAVAEALTERESGTTEDKGKARQKAKEKAGKATKMGGKAKLALIVMLQESKQKTKPDYVRGVLDTLRLTEGAIALGKMDPEFKDFVKTEEKLIKEAAEAEAQKKAEAAKKKAEGKGAKK